VFAGQRRIQLLEPKTTQIYEGTNQVQRIVMARQLLAGVQSHL
jgi:alkylation response protein AidB-like acyl-CoA dehydrogenase